LPLSYWEKRNEVEKMKKTLYLMTITGLLIVSIFVASGCFGLFDEKKVVLVCTIRPCCRTDSYCKDEDCQIGSGLPVTTRSTKSCTDMFTAWGDHPDKCPKGAKCCMASTRTV
jgi:hypothetical protein